MYFLYLNVDGVVCHTCADVYCYGTHLVVTVDIMGVIVKKDVRDKLVIYAREYISFFLLVFTRIGADEVC